MKRSHALIESSIQLLEMRICMSAAVPGLQASAGDFNGDGKIDLAISSFGRHLGLSIRLGDGHGHFGTPTEIAARSFGRNGTLGVGDLNNDNHPDIVVALSDDSRNNGGVYLLLNKGNGTFNAPVRLGGNTFASKGGGVAIGDWNGDGDYDVYVDTRTTIRRNHHTRHVGDVSLLFGNGDGTFGARTVIE